MNYREFFKNKKPSAKDIQSLMPEGVNQKQFNMGIKTEKEHTDDEFTAAKIAGDHLGEDPEYYTKLSAAGLEEEGQEQEECATCGCGDPTDDHDDDHDHEGFGDDQPPYDDFNGGLPKLGGALSIPHLGDPIRMAKIISVGPIGKGPANGNLSGYSSMGGKGATGKGVAKDQGGLEVTPDSEPITAGGKKVDGGIATKSVGGSVVPGEGQEQGGKNTVGTIADTAKLDESKQKVRKIVKDVLKEITFDKKSGKWVRLDEGGHKAGCKCGFCKNKGNFGKKKKKDKEDKSEEMDETVDMKMGTSYKTVQPRMYKVQDDDFARTNQYEPEISEQYDEEEECMAEQRYTELANAPRNLNEAEIAELKTLREKIDKMQMAKRNYGLSQGGVEPNVFDEGRCEDWPCCGHEAGDCPSRDPKTGAEVWSCAGCRGKLPKNSRSSLCPRCIKRLHRSMDQDPTGQDADNLFGDPGGNYQNENTVNMKMGPAHKVAGKTQARVQADDQARTVQYDPEMTEGGEPSGDMKISEEEIQSLMKNEYSLVGGASGTGGEQPEQGPEKHNGFMASLSTLDAQAGKELYTALRKALTNRELQTREGVEAAQKLMRAILKKFPELAKSQSQGMKEVHDASKEPVVQQGHKGQDGFRLWICDKCGQEVSVSSTEHRPDPIRWDDGHICYFHEAPQPESGEGIGSQPAGLGEAGGGAVQHSSMRTVGNGGNLPQDPDTRWADDLDEVTKKVSKAVKAIQKGQKGKKTKKNPKLKFQPAKHTTSGVHKRKT